MFLNPEYVVLSLMGSAFFAVMSLMTWLHSSSTSKKPYLSRFTSMILSYLPPTPSPEEDTKDFADLIECHETAARLAELIHKDGAGTWPPTSNYDHSSWPMPLRPYLDIYYEMAPLLATSNPSLDDDINKVRIDYFRSRQATLLDDHVDLDAVTELLKAAESGRWDVFPRDVYNAFYCCIAWHRHAYRWGTIPAVRHAQLQLSLPLPSQLTQPWEFLQRNFGLNSESGNMMSNIILNFSPSGTYQLRINSALAPLIQHSEEEFSRVCREVEVFALPVYISLVRVIVDHSRGDFVSCLSHLRKITSDLRPLMAAYYDRVHDATIARSAWLSHVQGFYAWGMGYQDEVTGEWIKFDGLSGNQVMLFQALDAFLGMDVYLSKEMLEGNVPRLQREFCAALKRASFREGLGKEGVQGEIRKEMGEIVKRLRLFRTAHRTRAKEYLLVPAPERLPMTAGKSLLKADMEQSLEFLDEFMVGRLKQTV